MKKYEIAKEIMKVGKVNFANNENTIAWLSKHLTKNELVAMLITIESAKLHNKDFHFVAVMLVNKAEMGRKYN